MKFQIFRISCYYQNEKFSENLRYAGTHGCVTKHHDFVNFEQILKTEMTDKHFEYQKREIHLRQKKTQKRFWSQIQINIFIIFRD